MNYTFLGNTGVKVSELCYGTMSFGGDADEKTSTEMFNRCREVGINFFDCANVYAKGRSEEILGKLIADCRDGSFLLRIYAAGRKGAVVVLNADRLEVEPIATPRVRTGRSVLVGPPDSKDA